MLRTLKRKNSWIIEKGKERKKEGWQQQQTRRKHVTTVRKQKPWRKQGKKANGKIPHADEKQNSWMAGWMAGWVADCLKADKVAIVF